MKYLVDANVLSEPSKSAPDERVVLWLNRNDAQIVSSSIVLGELLFGILSLPSGRGRAQLQKWFDDGILRVRVLEFDAATANVWARLLARLRKKGFAMPIKDSLIAATALQHGLTIITRNTSDYQNAGVPLLNPFKR